MSIKRPKLEKTKPMPKELPKKKPVSDTQYAKAKKVKMASKC